MNEELRNSSKGLHSDPTQDHLRKPSGHGAVQAARRADAAIALRAAGANFGDIADNLGYPDARAVSTAIELRLADTVGEQDRATMRELASVRLERLLRAVWLAAVDPNNPQHLAANARAQDLIGRHAKLWGLDAPTEVVVHNPTASEIDAWVSKVMSAKPQIIEAEVVGE